jgi:hypothetical protein
MAASKSTKSPIGVTQKKNPTGMAVPAALGLEDSSGNMWYLWFDTTGDLRTTDAETFEAAGFNYDSGGTVVGAMS